MSGQREDALTDLQVWVLRTKKMWLLRPDSARHPIAYREGVVDTLSDLGVLLQGMLDEEF